jgi:hypothetical protein
VAGYGLFEQTRLLIAIQNATKRNSRAPAEEEKQLLQIGGCSMLELSRRMYALRGEGGLRVPRAEFAGGRERPWQVRHTGKPRGAIERRWEHWQLVSHLLRLDLRLRGSLHQGLQHGCGLMLA